MKKLKKEIKKEIESGIEKEEEKGRKLDLKKKENRQLMWAVILMVSVFLIIILVPIIKINFFDKFVYLKLDFQKTKLGNIPFYSTRVPITDKFGNVAGLYSINIRNDPRKLEEVNFTRNFTDVDYIYFKEGKTVYISLDPKMDPSEDITIALIPLAGFLRDFAKQNVSSAYSDFSYALQNNVPYVTCSSNPDNTVIHVNSGDKTEIRKTARNCYELIYANGEILKTTERFMMLILEKYMSYFYKE